MTKDVSVPTSPTLLGQLAALPFDQAAWAAFAQRYGRKIYGWCRHWGLQQADAEDVTQQVLVKLVQKMRTFAYDSSKSFRAWLKTVTRHAWSDFVQSRERREAGQGGSHVPDLLLTLRAQDDLLQRMDEEFTRDLREEAFARVRLRVQARTWDAFRLLALEGKSGAEAAATLEMKVATVFVARSKVQKMIQEEVRQLEEPRPDTKRIEN